MKYIKGYKLFEGIRDDEKEDRDYIEKFFNMYSIDGYVSLFDTIIYNSYNEESYIMNGLIIKGGNIYLQFTRCIDKEQSLNSLRMLHSTPLEYIIDIIDKHYPEFRESYGMGFFELKKEV